MHKKVDAHPDHDSLVKDNQLVDELYNRGILRGRTSSYSNVKQVATSYLRDGFVDPHQEIIDKIKACTTEEELLSDELEDCYVDYGVWGHGRDQFTTLSDYCPEEDDER